MQQVLENLIACHANFTEQEEVYMRGMITTEQCSQHWNYKWPETGGAGDLEVISIELLKASLQGLCTCTVATTGI